MYPSILCPKAKGEAAILSKEGTDSLFFMFCCEGALEVRSKNENPISAMNCCATSGSMLLDTRILLGLLEGLDCSFISLVLLALGMEASLLFFRCDDDQYRFNMQKVEEFGRRRGNFVEKFYYPPTFSPAPKRGVIDFCLSRFRPYASKLAKTGIRRPREKRDLVLLQPSHGQVVKHGPVRIHYSTEYVVV